MVSTRSVLPDIDAVVVLGSGMSDAFDDANVELVDDPELSGSSRVIGHRGRLAVWRTNGWTVLLVMGRRHLYEGCGVERITRVVDVAAARGARCAILTNAAGGIHPRLSVGDIMVISGLNPILLGRNAARTMSASHGESIDASRVALPRALEQDSRGALHRASEQDSRSDAHRYATNSSVIDIALQRGVRLSHGVYAGVIGPSYETRAEIRMLRRMGADAVGMSTVNEWYAAAGHGMHVVGLSLITNTASDTAIAALDHADVVDVATSSQRTVRIAIESALDAVFTTRHS